MGRRSCTHDCQHGNVEDVQTLRTVEVAERFLEFLRQGQDASDSRTSTLVMSLNYLACHCFYSHQTKLVARTGLTSWNEAAAGP